MNELEKPKESNSPAEPETTQLSEARRAVEDYVKELRELIRRLRQRLPH